MLPLSMCRLSGVLRRRLVGVLRRCNCRRRPPGRLRRYTVKRLRREIEPVERHDFMRFLFEWQHLTPDTRSE
ncbi:hypothetical protein SB780_41855, partial [Burkholderia sp. SIMBA_057]